MVRSLPPSNWQLHTVFARPARCSFHSTNETGQPEQKLYIFPPPHKFTRSPCCYFWLQGIRKCGVGVDSNSIKSIPTLVKIYQLVQCSNVRSTNPHTHTQYVNSEAYFFLFSWRKIYYRDYFSLCAALKKQKWDTACELPSSGSNGNYETLCEVTSQKHLSVTNYRCLKNLFL
jgi:hypothetical protein